MRFIVVGCGRMGAGLAQVLGSRGHSISVVDVEPRSMHRLAQPFKGKKIVGSGLDRAVLLESGIERADGLAAVTSSDETNIVVTRTARLFFHVPRVVARLYDPGKMGVYQRLGIQVVAPIFWAVDRFADLLSYSDLDTVLSLGNGQVEIVEIEVPPLLVGRKVSSVTIPGEVNVIAISRKGKAFLPTSETLFRRDDSMHIAVMASSAERLKAMLAL